MFFSGTNLHVLTYLEIFFFNLVVYSFYSDDKDTCVSYSCGSIDLFMS